MDFYKLEKNSYLKGLNIKENYEVYALEKNNIIIGYGILTENNDNKIEIFIKEEYRGNGYGKYIFGKMIEELKKEKYKEIKLTFKRDNYRIKNIIIYYGGLQLHTNEIEENYILPIK